MLETVNSILIIYSKRLGLDSKGLGLYLDLESTFVDSSASLRILTATSHRNWLFIMAHYGSALSTIRDQYRNQLRFISTAVLADYIVNESRNVRARKSVTACLLISS